MSRFMVAKVDKTLWGGRSALVFQDNGVPGMGVPRYAGNRMYEPSEIPTAVGARYIVGEDENDEGTVIVGSKYEGGKEAYRKSVWEYYEKHHKALKYPDPRKVA